MNKIADHLRLAYQNITEKKRDLAIGYQNIQLLAVSKTKPINALLEAYDAGQRHFAENYPQEFADKAFALSHLSDITWHFIGPLQSNKTKLVATYADYVHSINRLKIAKRLSEQRDSTQTPLNVLIQINISNEESKSGIAPNDMLSLAHEISQLPNLCLKGLMAIPAPNDSENAFKSMQQLSKQLVMHYSNATELSMGMSDDWPLALRYGATMIRLGTAIFGAREYNKE